MDDLENKLKQEEQELEKDRLRALKRIKDLGSEEDSMKGKLSLAKILGGDILTARMIRKQIWLIILIVFFLVVYISNRYASEQEIQEIDALQKELTNAKYRALSSASKLTERCRQSKVLQILRENHDTLLQVPDQPPYIIEENKAE